MDGKEKGFLIDETLERRRVGVRIVRLMEDEKRWRVGGRTVYYGTDVQQIYDKALGW